MKNLFSKFFNEPDGDITQGLDVDEKTKNRNTIITLALILIVLLLSTIAYHYFKKDDSPADTTPEAIQGFGEIIESEFVDKDNQSALTIMQQEADQLQQENSELKRQVKEMELRQERFAKESRAREEAFKKEIFDRVDEFKNRQYDDVRKIAQETALDNIPDMSKVVTEKNDKIVNAKGEVETSRVLKSNTQDFGIKSLPPVPQRNRNVDNSSKGAFAYDPDAVRAFDQGGIDQFTFEWEHTNEVDEKKKRTIKNYVPTGTFVTAVVTGGADADGGALGQNNTAPMVFQTVNEGILPNGSKSRLKSCTITGSAYGEISSSRGIVRTNRLSCIFADDEIIDVPVKGTVFNFGRNGIRGTTILKNGKIIQMAGVAGILTGLGETGQAISETTSTSALGSTTSINSDDAVLNLLGNATASVGEKLADYYIKLAELYHPIVELNPGNLVNIVFLEGFPLDSTQSEAYEAQQAAKEAAQNSPTNQVLNVVTNNPLQQEVSKNIPNFPQQNSGGQIPPFGQ